MVYTIEQLIEIPVNPEGKFEVILINTEKDLEIINHRPDSYRFSYFFKEEYQPFLNSLDLAIEEDRAVRLEV